MSRRAQLPALAAALLCAAGLSACLTPHVQPTPSKAIAEAHVNVNAKPAGCPTTGLDAISPVDAAFPFDEATISELGQKHITAVARWLACNPKVETVIKPDGDHHGDTAHENDLAQRRAQAVQAALRDAGAKDTVIHLLARGAADPVTGPHVLVTAVGRGW